MNPMTASLPAVVIYCLMATAITFSCLLFLLLRLNIKALERCVFAHQKGSDEALESLRQAGAQMAQDVDELLASAAAPSTAAPGCALNLSRRAQALRMHRRGDSAEQIALALAVPRQEIELLLKVHQILIANL